MMEERGRGGVVPDFQTGGSDPAKQCILFVDNDVSGLFFTSERYFHLRF